MAPRSLENRTGFVLTGQAVRRWTRVSGALKPEVDIDRSVRIDASTVAGRRNGLDEDLKGELKEAAVGQFHGCWAATSRLTGSLP